MILSWGSYAHDDAEVELNISQEAILNQAGVPYAHRVRWEIIGQKLKSNQSALIAAVNALGNAYKLQYQDLKLIGANGATVLSLKSNQTTGGLRVVQGPDIPTMREGCFSNYFPFVCVVEGEVPITGATEVLENMQERIKQIGGGPRYGFLEGVVGPVQRQRIRQATVYKYQQSGFAIGLYARPVAASPLWPAWLKEQGDFELMGPRRIGTAKKLFETNWSYSFESPFPLNGSPNSW